MAELRRLQNIFARIFMKRESGIPLTTWESEALKSIVSEDKLPVLPSREFPPKYQEPYQYPTKTSRVKSPQSVRRWDVSNLGDLDQYSDVVPRNRGESDSAYRARIQNDLLQRLKMSFKHLDANNLKNINYDPKPGVNVFQNAGTNSNMYSSMRMGKLAYGDPREFVTLDIETDDQHRPITVSALKQVFNRETGKFETIDSYQRFYVARNRDLVSTYDTHRLTHASLKQLRSQQGAKYSTKYDDTERQALKDFLGSSVIVGHNIVDFDLPNLFGYSDPLNNQTIDTFFAAMNKWKDKKNGLDDVFQRIFGMTMAQAGLPHHNSMSDVIANAMIAQEMLKMKGSLGKAVRYVATHPNVHIAPMDSMLGSQIIQGSYREYTNIERYVLGGDTMAGTTDGATIEELMRGPAGAPQSGYDYDFDEFGNRSKMPRGLDEDILNNSEDLDIAISSLAGVAEHVEKAAKIANETYAKFLAEQKLGTISGNMKLITQASRYDTQEEMKEFFELAGYESSGIDILVNRATKLQELERKRKGPSASLQNLMWSAQRAGAKGLATRFSDLLNEGDPDPYEVWEARQDFRDYLKEQRKKASDDAKYDREWDRFYSNKKDIVSKYLRYGYSKEDIADITSATDKEELAEALDTFRFEQRKQHEERVAVRSGLHEKAQRISAAQTELELDKLNDEFTRTTSAIDVFQKAILSTAAKLNDLPTESYQKVLKMQQEQVSGVLGAAKGVVPNFILRPMGRFANAYMNFARSGYAKTQFAWDIMHYGQAAAPFVGSAIGGVAGGIAGGPGGAVIGSSLGAGVGTGMAGLGNLFESAVTYFPNKWREKQLTQYGEAIQGRLNLLGGYADIISTPFRVLANVSKLLSRNFVILTRDFIKLSRILSNTISGGLDAYNNMGSPLTPLTGVGYGGFEKTSYIDILTNARRGTTNSAYEAFAQAQQDLYWGGRFNQSRLTAASLLGVYGDVYANGGDTRAQYARTVNTLFRNMQNNPSQRQFILGQASLIDNQLPQILSYMERANRYLGGGVTYESLQNAGTWGVYKRDLSERESDAFYAYRTQRGIIKGSFENTKMRFAGLMWDSFGRDIMDGLNRALDNVYTSFAQSKFLVGMKELANDIKNQKWGEVWEDIKSAFKSGWDHFKSIINKIGGSLEIKMDVEGIKEAVARGFSFINDAWWTLVNSMISSLSNVIDYVNTISIDIDAMKELFKKGSTDKQILKMGYDQNPTFMGGTASYAWVHDVGIGLPEKRDNKGNLVYTVTPKKGSSYTPLFDALRFGSSYLSTDRVSILGKDFNVSAFTDPRSQSFQDLQTLLNKAEGQGWNTPYQLFRYLETTGGGREIRNRLFTQEEWEKVKETQTPPWLSGIQDALDQIKISTDEQIFTIVSELVDKLAHMALKVQVDNNIKFETDPGIKKVSENKGVIPNLLSFTINGKPAVSYAGNLVQKLTAASTGGQ